MESKDQLKPKAAPRVYGVEGREKLIAPATTLPPAPPDKCVDFPIGGAFLACVAIGMTVSNQLLPGTPGQVHLTLSELGDTKSDRDCDHDFEQ